MLQKVKVVEIFYSIQGEGKLAGKPSIFIRFFGCTLNCPGFGVDPRTLAGKLKDGVIDKTEDYKNWEVEKVAKEHKEGKYNSIKELPLVRTGCDSYCSWHPAFADLCKEMDPLDVVEEIMKLEIENINHALKDTEIVFTGGEPLLYQGFCCEVCDELYRRGASMVNVTFETNGTLLLQENFKKCFFKNKHTRVLFSVSPKLRNSGCSKEKAYKPAVVATYYECKQKEGNDIYLKFVIDSKETLGQIHSYVERVEEELKNKITPEVYLMPVGGVYSEMYINNCKRAAEICLKEGYKYSPRLQVDLFKNEWGT